MDKIKNWKGFVQLVQNTIRSSRKLSALINRYLAEKDAIQKRLLSQKIDYQFEHNHVAKDRQSE